MKTVEPLRICRDCGLEAHTEEDLELFVKSKTGKYGRQNLCKKCLNKRSKKWREDNIEERKKYEREYGRNHPENYRRYRKNNPFKVSITLLKYRSKKKGLEFDLDPEYIEQLWDKCGGLCSMTGIPMLKTSDKNDPLVMSVDRIDLEQGYIKGNVRLVNRWYNWARSDRNDAFTLEMCKRVVETSRISIGIEY